MTAAGEVLAVHRATVDTPCRRCHEPIRRGLRVALVAGLGAVHLRCLIAHHDDTMTGLDQEPATPTAARLDRPAVADNGDQADASPAAARPPSTTPRPAQAPLVDDEREDPRDREWWDR